MLSSTLMRKEHPRIRGENFLRLYRNPVPQGTSPHTRGKLGLPDFRPVEGRNIPAYAGKTDDIAPSTISRTEHPRIRGENKPTLPDELEKAGTSPHTRGKHSVTGVVTGVIRNIPAYAGKTVVAHQTNHRTWEHPRIRGENNSVNLLQNPACGTSPHTRGKRIGAPGLVAGVRNIPAYAGKTVRCTWRLR